MGKHKGLYRHFERKNPCVSTFGCFCHMMHNTASYASKAFAQVTGFNVGDFLVDVFHYFDNSTKGQAMLKEFYIFCDQECRKIHGATRWLSKEVCITGVLKHYPSSETVFQF